MAGQASLRLGRRLRFPARQIDWYRVEEAPPAQRVCRLPPLRSLRFPVRRGRDGASEVGAMAREMDATCRRARTRTEDRPMGQERAVRPLGERRPRPCRPRPLLVRRRDAWPRVVRRAVREGEGLARHPVHSRDQCRPPDPARFSRAHSPSTTSEGDRRLVLSHSRKGRAGSQSSTRDRCRHGSRPDESHRISGRYADGVVRCGAGYYGPSVPHRRLEVRRIDLYRRHP